MPTAGSGLSASGTVFVSATGSGVGFASVGAGFGSAGTGAGFGVSAALGAAGFGAAGFGVSAAFGFGVSTGFGAAGFGAAGFGAAAFGFEGAVGVADAAGAAAFGLAVDFAAASFGVTGFGPAGADDAAATFGFALAGALGFGFATGLGFVVPADAFADRFAFSVAVGPEEATGWVTGGVGVDGAGGCSSPPPRTLERAPAPADAAFAPASTALFRMFFGVRAMRPD